MTSSLDPPAWIAQLPPPVHPVAGLWWHWPPDPEYRPPFPCAEHYEQVVFYADPTGAECWIVQHGPNPEAILRLPMPGRVGLGAQEYRECIAAWAARVHAQER